MNTLLAPPALQDLYLFVQEFEDHRLHQSSNTLLRLLLSALFSFSISVDSRYAGNVAEYAVNVRVQARRKRFKRKGNKKPLYILFGHCRF